MDIVDPPPMLSVRPPKSPTRAPLIATTPWSESSQLSALLPQSVTRQANPDRSQMVTSRFLSCFCVALVVISDRSPLSLTMPSTSHVASFSRFESSESSTNVYLIWGALSWSSHCYEAHQTVSAKPPHSGSENEQA